MELAFGVVEAHLPGMIVVHHLENSRSQRVLWLLEELGAAYEVRSYARDEHTLLAPPELQRAHALGKAPILVHEDVTVAESGAILEYLVSRVGGGRFRPAEGTPEQLRYTYWLHYAEGSAMPPLLLKLVFDTIRRGPLGSFANPLMRAMADKVSKELVNPQIAQHFRYVEQELAQSTYFAGEELTAADVAMSFPLEAAAARAGFTTDTHPRILAFLDRIHARPAYQRALDRGGPYDIPGGAPRRTEAGVGGRRG